MKKLLVALLLIVSSVLSFGAEKFLMKNYHFQMDIYIIIIKSLQENLRKKTQILE